MVSLLIARDRHISSPTDIAIRDITLYEERSESSKNILAMVFTIGKETYLHPIT